MPAIWPRPDTDVTPSKIDVAGKILAGRRAAGGAIGTRDDALAIIGTWRSAHSWPLNAFKVTLRDRALKEDRDALVAQRLKRLSSIELKLKRFRAMQLSTMQDIGGCRAVLADVGMVEALVGKYEKLHAKSPQRGHVLDHKYDYLSPPKRDGYRSVHLVYLYQSRDAKNAVWNDMKIEIQIRSALQHAWATANETVSAFTDQQLKSGMGDDSWKRFFALMGSVIALREDRPTVPGTPGTREELVQELRFLDASLGVDSVLSASQAVIQMSGAAGPNSYYLLVLDMRAKLVTIDTFKDIEQARASDRYLAVEKEAEGNPDLNAVLVSTETAASLKQAFPNYYLDTTVFRRIVQETLSV
jgi:hypothetical protein